MTATNFSSAQRLRSHIDRISRVPMDQWTDEDRRAYAQFMRIMNQKASKLPNRKY